MTINLSEAEVQMIMDTNYDGLLEDMDNLCHLIDDLDIEDNEVVYDN